MPNDRSGLAALLSGHGFIAAEEEAGELLASAAGDEERLEALVRRRLTGEPLAWITGSVAFCGIEVRVHPGVYVPRPHSELLARRSIERLPVRGTAIDVCTGSGAIAMAMMVARPRARVFGCDLDARAVSCARANGVTAFRGDLLAPLAAGLRGQVDVIVAVVPYVPTAELSLLQRDTFAFESALPYDGGPDGTALLRRVMRESRRLLRGGGALLLELAGDQAELLQDERMLLRYGPPEVLYDEDGAVRGIECERL